MFYGLGVVRLPGGLTTNPAEVCLGLDETTPTSSAGLDTEKHSRKSSYEEGCRKKYTAMVIAQLDGRSYCIQNQVKAVWEKGITSRKVVFNSKLTGAQNKDVG